ncbi:MAG: acyl-CoA dehydrogenase family protein, partial [Rubrobacteraceae bacterium]
MNASGTRTVPDSRQNSSEVKDKHPEQTDILALDELLSDEELAVRDDARSFVQEKISPNIKDWYEDAHFPRE